MQRQFQYISCCCLSLHTIPPILWLSMFQYISCCCLSANILKKIIERMSFNTSHVVVYLYFSRIRLFFLTGFNTSHVVVYWTDTEIWEFIHSFQYISCCCLSQFYIFLRYSLPRFQYISCCCL